MAFFRQHNGQYQQLNDFSVGRLRDSVIGGAQLRRPVSSIRDTLASNDREKNTLSSYKCQTNKFIPFATTAIGLNMDHILED